MKDEVRKVTKSVEVEKSYAITLVHLQAAFFILLLGFLLATTALLVEKVYHRCYFYGLMEGFTAPLFTLYQNGKAGAAAVSSDARIM